MKSKYKIASFLAVLLVFSCVCAGILPLTHETAVKPSGLAESGGGIIEITLDAPPLAGTPSFSIPVPAASGTTVKKTDKAEIDYSNAKDGYVMVKYLQKTTKNLRVVIKTPSGASYTYTLNASGYYEVFPLSDGNGSYTVGVYEQTEGNKYATANSATVSVTMTNEYAPFIRPNQYINYNKDSNAVAKAAELVKGSKDLSGKISAIYNYVINNIKYDKELAASVKSGYIPNVDAVLKNGKGICFDYSALMVAMLRSQGIPTKLVIGYSGDVYHAWINVYSDKTGWVNNVIYFDGKSWTLMDPTFASTGNQKSDVMKYIGDASNYSAKYYY